MSRRSVMPSRSPVHGLTLRARSASAASSAAVSASAGGWFAAWPVAGACVPAVGTAAGVTAGAPAGLAVEAASAGGFAGSVLLHAAAIATTARTSNEPRHAVERILVILIMQTRCPLLGQSI